MPLRLSVRVGQSVAVGGPTTVRIESKNGQQVALVFDADRSVPIRMIPNTDAPTPRGAPVGLGHDDGAKSPSASGLGRK